MPLPGPSPPKPDLFEQRAQATLNHYQAQTEFKTKQTSSADRQTGLLFRPGYSLIE
jgi:hypothetical protein